MLENIVGKVLAGLVSFSALMMSSYTGNDPVFLPLQSRTGHNYLLLKANLDNAFDNDFSDVFKCGKAIHLWYKVEIRQSNKVAFQKTYRHSVSYDPMHASWSLFKSETNQTEIFTTYQKLVDDISELECSIPRDNKWKIIEAKVEAWLPEIEISQSSRKVDLMVLWKFQKPTVKTTLNLESTS